VQYFGNREPPLDEVLNDPIVRLVMGRDRLLPNEARADSAALRQWFSKMDARK
jgi:hypothetical protein